MPVLTGEVLGQKELDKLLLDLGETYNDPRLALKILRPAIKKSLEPLQEAVSKKTPIDRGELLDSLGSSVRRPSKTDLKSDYVENDAVIIGVTGFTGDTALGKQAYAVEFGSRTTRPRSMLRSAFAKEKDVVLKTFVKEFKISLKKTIEKLEKKSKKKSRSK